MGLMKYTAGSYVTNLSLNTRMYQHSPARLDYRNQPLGLGCIHNSATTYNGNRNSVMGTSSQLNETTLDNILYREIVKKQSYIICCGII